MDTVRRHSFSNFGGLDSPLSIALLVCLVAALSYFAPRLEWVLMLHPQTVWPVWPSCALLVAVLVLVPRRIWPILIPISFASIVLFDLQKGVPVSSIAWFIAADTIEVLIAALCLSYFFDGVPNPNSIKAVAKYLLFAVILAPSAAAFLAAPGIGGDYWFGWRVSFFSDVLAFLTLTPAILSWVSGGRAWLRKSLAYHLEAAALFAALVVFAYVTFVPASHSYSTALLYSLVPCLLWSALRFGAIGVNTSMIAVMFLSIWGAVHGRGPFTEPAPFDQVLSLQLFLFFTATPFMVLAALVEERKLADVELKESEERLRLAVQAGRTYAFDWDMTTDVVVRSGQCADIFNWMDDPTRDTGREVVARIHPDDRGVYAATDSTLTPRSPAYQTVYRMSRPDGSVLWLETRGHAFFDSQGRRQRIRGIVADITARKHTEEALRWRDAELAEEQRLAKLGSWRWDVATDTVTWSEELYRISGRDPNLPAPSYQDHPKLYTAESWDRLRRAVEEALHTGAPYELDLEMVRPDGTKRWLFARGETQRDTEGGIVQLHGTVQDITERKAAEEMLRDMSGRLIAAHEEERSRIARELHDDLSQRMAILQIGVEQFEQGATGLSSEARQKLHNIAEIAAEVSSTIHDLSHRLHPSKLDALGLVPSLRGFCREFSESHQLSVYFAHDHIPNQIPKDVTLCLFRIVQEALRNVVKHSGAPEVNVELSGLGDRIELRVSDSGVGFDPESEKGSGGLGLLSMRERLRLIGGDLAVESEPSHGTRIRVRAPLPATGAQVTSKQEAYKAGA
jgi:signal transduction histidine kinase/integral membrane sensor domain MASE1